VKTQNFAMMSDNVIVMWTWIERFTRMKQSMIRNPRKTTKLSTKWLQQRITVLVCDKFSLAFHDLLNIFTATNIDGLILATEISR